MPKPLPPRDPDPVLRRYLALDLFLCGAEPLPSPPRLPRFAAVTEPPRRAS